MMLRKSGVRKIQRLQNRIQNLGIFQQSPTIPLSTDPDLKKKKPKKRVHMSTVSKRLNVCSSDKHKPRKTSPDVKLNGQNATSGTNISKTGTNRKRKRYSKLTPREKTENRKKWTEWIYKHDSNKEENEMSANRTNLKSCSKISSKRKKLDGFEELLKIYESTDENGLKFVGLRNKKNDCWLNSLVQCIYSLPLRSRLLDDIKRNTQCKVTSALINVISNMMYTTSTPLYPIDLHEAIQEQYNLVSGEQQDIHESFTLLCSNGTENMNDIIARHF